MKAQKGASSQHEGRIQTDPVSVLGLDERGTVLMGQLADMEEVEVPKGNARK